MRLNQPLVSVIVVCYNHEKFVAQTVESVLKQTYTNLELFVIDNIFIFAVVFVYFGILKMY